MYTRGNSYSAASQLCKRVKPLRTLAVPALALIVGGCASIGIGEFNRSTGLTVPMGARAVPASLTTSETVDASDWEVVRRTIAGIPVNDSGRFDWTNPDTKSSGNVTILAVAAGRSATACRPFATTINDVRGIRGYRGEACQRSNGGWQLSGVSADDTKLL